MSSDWFGCVLVIPFYVAKVFSDTTLNLHQVQKLTFSLGIVLVCVWKVIIEPIYLGNVTNAGKGDCYAKMTTLL